MIKDLVINIQTQFIFLLDTLRKLKNIYYSFKVTKKVRSIIHKNLRVLILKEYSLIKNFVNELI